MSVGDNYFSVELVMHDPGLNITPCEFCKKPGAIPVRFLSEAEWHTVCADCGKAQVLRRLQDEERASWNVGAALGKTYDHKLRRVRAAKRKKNATTPRRVQTKTRSRRSK